MSTRENTGSREIYECVVFKHTWILLDTYEIKLFYKRGENAKNVMPKFDNLILVSKIKLAHTKFTIYIMYFQIPNIFKLVLQYQPHSTSGSKYSFQLFFCK